MRDFYKDLIDSNNLSESKEILDLYEKKFHSKIKNRIKITDRSSQKKGYDIELHLEDGRILTIEEKFRPDSKKFYPDLLVEIKHTNGDTRMGWLYKSNAEILAYFQRKPDDSAFNLTLWKLKEISEWTKSNNFLSLLDLGYIKEIISHSNINKNQWTTINYAIPFNILKKTNLNYKANKINYLPLEFFKS